MQIFYTPNIQGTGHTLSEDESKHCIRVLRMEKGDALALVNGKGNLHIAEIVDPNPKRCEVAITSTKTDFGKRDYHLHIAIAPTKNMDRLEWFLEKCTEIGIDEITPILCERSERKVVNLERLEKITVAAMKQSVKAYLPKINGMLPLKQFVGQSFEGQKFIAHCNSWKLQPLKNIVKPQTSITILIGPEGDFSPNEVAICEEKDFHSISLGTSRLRTETAGVVACSWVSFINQP